MVAYLTATRTLDPYSGQPTGFDWSNPARVEAPSAFILNAGSSSENDGQSTTTAVQWTLYIPEGEVEPRPGDRIDHDGVEFVMNGRPVREKNPFTGWAPYAQVQLTMDGGS